MLADSADKTIKAFKDHTSKKNKLVDAFDKGADTLVWQGLASVVRSRSVYARAVRCPKLIQRMFAGHSWACHQPSGVGGSEGEVAWADESACSHGELSSPPVFLRASSVKQPSEEVWYHMRRKVPVCCWNVCLLSMPA